MAKPRIFMIPAPLMGAAKNKTIAFAHLNPTDHHVA